MAEPEIPELTERELAQLEAAIVFLKHGQTDLARETLLNTGPDSQLKEKIQKFIDDHTAESNRSIQT